MKQPVDIPDDRRYQRDWAAWHGAYDRPESGLARRLRAVQDQICMALGRLGPGPVRAVSLCAGQGRDLIGVLADHPRRGDVVARLVELDQRNVGFARAAARASGLGGIECVVSDASHTDVYVGSVPADIVLACGIFGNITNTDIERMISLLPQLCASGATVIWTRNRKPPDVTPDICRWFEKHGFEKLWQSPVSGSEFGVGAHRYRGTPMPLERGVRMFTFVGYDALRKGAPWPT